jgi:hypothetical protein
MALIPLSSERLLELSPLRRQLRDVSGISEIRPGIFAAGRTQLVELLDQDGVAVARLADLGHGAPQLFVLDDTVKRRTLIDSLRLRVKKLAED